MWSKRNMTNISLPILIPPANVTPMNLNCSCRPHWPGFAKHCIGGSFEFSVWLVERNIVAVLVQLYLKYCVHFWAQRFQKDIQTRVTKMGKGCRWQDVWGLTNVPWFVCPRVEEAEGVPHRAKGQWALLSDDTNGDRESGVDPCQRESCGGYGKLFHKTVVGMEQAP